MRAVNIGLGLSFLMVGVFVAIGAIHQEYYTSVGPGPGFFPFWLAIILIALTGIWLTQVYLGPKEPLAEGLIPDRGGLFRIFAVLAALIIYALVFEELGFRLTTLLFLVFVLYVLSRKSLAISMSIAVAGSFGVYFLFHDLLGVYLPVSTIGFLEQFGV